MKKEQTWHIEILSRYTLDTLYDEYFTGTEVEANEQAEFIRKEIIAGNVKGVSPEDVGGFTISETD